MKNPARALLGLLILGHFTVAFGSVEAAEKPKKTREEPSEKGRLDSFEEEATEKKPVEETTHEYEDVSDYSFLEACFELTFGGLLYGGVGSWERVATTGDPELARSFSPRPLGEPLIPFFALEVSKQSMTGLEATDIRGEVGYGPLAFSARYTGYTEILPRDTMDMWQLHGLYRMTFADPVELDIGVGTTSLTGNRSHTGASFTTPLRIQFTRVLGAEFRPVWSWLGASTVHDYQTNLVVRVSVISLRAGYRWVSVPGVSLSGPVLGFALQL